MRAPTNAFIKMITAAPLPAEFAAAACAAPAFARARRTNLALFAACLGAAMALNLAAMSVFAAVATRWQAVPRGGAETSWITAITIDPAAEAAAPNEAPARTIDPSKPRGPLFPARHQTGPVPNAPSQVSPSFAVAQSEPMRFYTSGEVDWPAEPEPDSDWNLDPAALDAVGVQALVFDIFVGPGGEVIDCEIIEPRALPEDARLALQERLKQTVLQPARRHDMAVASVRRIEVSVAAPGS